MLCMQLGRPFVQLLIAAWKQLCDEALLLGEIDGMHTMESDAFPMNMIRSDSLLVGIRRIIKKKTRKTEPGLAKLLLFMLC